MGFSRRNIINLLKKGWRKILKWDWILIPLSLISFELILILFAKLHLYSNNFQPDNGLEIILTINGLFSAILITFFFNRLSQIWTVKKELYDEAILYSQKITDFRRVCLKLTEMYGIWEDDDSTKNLLDSGRFKHIDYYDYKLMSFSDYKPVDEKLIDELYEHKNFKEGISGMYLAMSSLVKDRKSDRIIPDSELYGDYQRKGVYTVRFVEKAMEIGYFSTMWYFFNKNYSLIKYYGLGKSLREQVLSAIGRIDKKFLGRDLNNELMAELCNDMQEYYLTELYDIQRDLKFGLGGTTKLIFIIFLFSTIFGLILPFYAYFGITDNSTKLMLSEIIVSINFGLLFFFVANLYSFVNRELTWID